MKTKSLLENAHSLKKEGEMELQIVGRFIWGGTTAIKTLGQIKFNSDLH